MNSWTRTHAAALLSAVCLMTLGCSSGQSSEPSYVPPPRSGPIPDPILPAVADEMVDQMVQELAIALPNVPEISNSEFQYVLAVSHFDTSRFSQRDRFEAAFSSIVTRLMRNQAVSDSFMVFQTDARSGQALLATIAGGNTADFDDPAQRESSIADRGKYDPRYVYMLTGKFFQIDGAPGEKAYRLFFEVVKPVERRTVLKQEFSRNLRWNSRDARWAVAD